MDCQKSTLEQNRRKVNLLGMYAEYSSIHIIQVSSQADVIAYFSLKFKQAESDCKILFQTTSWIPFNSITRPVLVKITMRNVVATLVFDCRAGFNV